LQKHPVAMFPGSKSVDNKLVFNTGLIK
jgi:hypothetical protein